MRPTRIYLDHAATTPCRPEAIDAMHPLLADGYNPSSAHADGRRARAALDEARSRVASLLGARPREIVFTAGGSEADVFAILGVARARQADGRHIVSAVTEHHAVLGALDVLCAEGWQVTVLPVDGQGRVDVAEFGAALRPDTVLASIMLANNEVGTLAPIRDLAALAHERGVAFHSDAVQAPGQLPLDVSELGVDLLSLSAHKFYGPKGVGLLFVRSATPLVPLIVGGGQEHGLRSGTENVAGIVGLATALELAVRELPETAPRVAALRDAFEDGVRKTISDVVVYGGEATRLANNANLGFPNTDREALLVGLDLQGISASAGSACAAGSAEPSHVIAALGGQSTAVGNIRFSLGRQTTRGEIDSVLARLPAIVAQAREFRSFVGTT